jgi:DNA repair exonuclease SbcCD ATPase subunit
MLSAITFGLFGKTIKKVTKAQIINSINGKACLVEVEVQCGDDLYLVRRGIKPNIFEVYKNAELIDQSSVTDYQDYLEEFVLKCSYRTFCQTSIISIENYRPFMALTTAERRDFIEDILDIKIFTAMNQLIKGKVTKNKDELNLSKSSLTSKKEKLLIQKENITTLENIHSTGIATLDKKLEEYTTELEAVTKTLESESSKTDNLKRERVKLKEMLSTKTDLVSMINSINNQIKTSARDVKFFEENDNCNVCRQPLQEHHSKSILEAHRTASGALLESRRSIELNLGKYDAYDALNESLTNREYEHNSTVSVANSSIGRLNKLIAETNKEKAKFDASVDLNELKSELKLGAAEAKKVSDRISELNEEKSYNDVMLELFKDSGVKSKIVQQYIPVINKLVNSYLEKLDFFVSFNLDHEFNETIKSRHRDDFTYSSFSMGEKMRIDMALMFTFRKLAQMRNSFSCNILCMDELCDASVDVDGIDLLMEIFNSEEFASTNLFVISHGNKDRFEERFDGSYEFYKRDGFSQFR